MSERHLALLDGGWALWRTVAVRAAGFPVARLVALGAGDLAERTEEALDAELDLDAAWARATAAAQRIGEKLVRRRVLRVLGKARVPADAPPHLLPVLGEVTAAAAAARAARERFAHAFAAEERRAATLLRAEAADPLLREAVLWQNRAAVRTGLDELLRHGDADSAAQRRRLNLVASYLQRYAAKNDTIGFFGPIGWAQLRDDGPAIVQRPGSAAPAARSVFFEYWAMDAIADALAADPALKLDLAPRRSPWVRVAGVNVFRRAEPPFAIAPAAARLLALADGERPARSLAEEVLADRALGVADAAAVWRLLDGLVADGLVFWTLEVPRGHLRHEEGVLRILDRAGGAAAERGRAKLGELTTLRDQVAQAAGSPERLGPALDALDGAFSLAVGAAATRRPGENYAGRTVIYEDCRRAGELALGPELRAGLQPLALLLQSARWFTHQVAARYRQVGREIYRGLAAETGQASVSYPHFWERFQPHTTGGSALRTWRKVPAIVEETKQELRARWAALLHLENGQRRREFSYAALAGAVADRFAAPGPGAPTMRYHSPDLLLAAHDEEAIRRGDYLVVLGEIHPALNLVTIPVFYAMHPNPVELRDLQEQDLPEADVCTVFAREQWLRASYFPHKRQDLLLELGDARTHHPRAQALAPAELLLEERGGCLLARTRDGRHETDLDVLHAFWYVAAAVDSFSVVAPLAHAPRVTIDRFVIARECWRLSVDEVDFAHAGSSAERYFAAQRWARSLGLPRFVFVKTPEENKALYVDLTSPAMVELMARVFRAASQVTVTEMLPGPDQAWLTDDEGRRYLSELRFCALDALPWRPER